MIWAVQGDAAQRAIVAWGLAWPPTVRAKTDNWRLPILAQLLEDPYEAVRAVAIQSLRKLRPQLVSDYDYAAPAAELHRAAEGLRETLRRFPELATWPGRSRVLITDQGTLDPDRLANLLRRRDNRPVLLNE